MTTTPNTFTQRCVLVAGPRPYRVMPRGLYTASVATVSNTNRPPAAWTVSLMALADCQKWPQSFRQLRGCL